jgi:hypothetical protein
MKKITILFSLSMLAFAINVVKAQNLIPNWNAGGATGVGSEANKWGFGSSDATNWGTANGTGIRYRDLTNIPIEGGGSYTGREFLYRWDNAGANKGSVMSLGVPVDAGNSTAQVGISMVVGKTYTITGYYSWLNNANAPTYEFGFSNTAFGAVLVSGSFPATVKNTYIPFTFSFTPTGSGDYFFQVRQTAGLDAGGNGGIIQLANLSITGATTLGLEELDATKNLNVYPNPVQNELNIVTNSDIAHISVYDLLGRSVLLKDKAEGVNLKSIDVTGLKSGSYILHIVTTDNKVEVLKFLK